MKLSFNKAAAIATIMALPFVSACTPDVAKLDTTLSSDQAQNGFLIACTIFNVLDQGYHAYVVANPDKISEKAQGYISLAEAALVDQGTGTSVCTAPYPTNVATLTAKVTAATINVYSAYTAMNAKPPVVTVSTQGVVTAETQ